MSSTRLPRMLRPGSPGDVIRLLEQHGFDLLERARGDVVARALEALDEKTRRENASPARLAGRASRHSRQILRAPNQCFAAQLAAQASDRDLVATASLRLASLMANQGQDVTSLLSGGGRRPAQRPALRAEAFR